MKKSLLILSMLALTATSARAYDTLEAGTADAPNYYLIKANRDNKYVSYSVNEQSKTVSGVEITTNLYRTDTPSEYSIWAVTPGADGTVQIKNYAADVYLVQFKAATGEFTGAINAVADVTDSPVDITVTHNADGSESFTIAGSGSGYYTLDATSGSVLFGNWVVNDLGTSYWASLVDVSNGATAALNGYSRDLYVSELQQYIANVPVVATQLQEGVDALQAMDLTAVSVDDITKAYNDAIDAANRALESALSDRLFAIKSVYRAANGQSSYLSMQVGSGDDPNYIVPTESKQSDITWFRFDHKGDAGSDLFCLNNPATNMNISYSNGYVGQAGGYVQSFPVLASSGDYCGIAFPYASNAPGAGFGINLGDDQKLSYMNLFAGSIWAIEDVSELFYANEVEAFKSKAEIYSASVPQISDVLNSGVNNLTYPGQNCTYTQIMNEWSSLLNNVSLSMSSILNGNTYGLKNLRREAKSLSCYLAVIGDGFGAGTDITDEKTWFEFEATDDNGVLLYNLAANKYMSWDYATDETSITISTKVVAVDSKDEAKPFYPVLGTVDDFYGASFAFESKRTGFGLDQDTNAGGLVSWYLFNGGGGVFSLIDADPDAIAKEATSSAVAELEAYVPNVSLFASTLNAGIESLNALKYSSDLSTKISQIVDNTKESVNNELKTGLDGKVLSLKSLRRENATGNASNTPYIALNTGTGNFSSVADDSNPTAWYLFTSEGEGGYTVRNYYNGEYVYTGTDGAYGNAQSSESESTAVYPVLISNGSYSGVAFPFSAGGKGYNVNEGVPTNLTSWNTTGSDYDGSIWAISPCEDKIEPYFTSVSTSVIEPLSLYGQNVSPAAEIFAAAHDDATAIEHTAGAPAQINTIAADAIADANELLKKGLDNKSVSIHSLRDGYVCAGEDGYTIQTAQSDLANYDFISAEDGGYYVYSPATKKYLGPSTTVEGSDSHPMTAVAEEADAVKVYPVIYHNGDKYGVAFPLSDSDASSTAGLNTGGKLYQYMINDAGSIFSIKVMGDSTGIEEITTGESAAQGIYDLSGRRLSAPVRGINIINGRKVLVK